MMHGTRRPGSSYCVANACHTGIDGLQPFTRSVTLNVTGAGHPSLLESGELLGTVRYTTLLSREGGCSYSDRCTQTPSHAVYIVHTYRRTHAERERETRDTVNACGGTSHSYM
eukprot:50791-Eustigmatos_ZCMA.PRE.1